MTEITETDVTLPAADGACLLPGSLSLPEMAQGLVIFAHGSGSSRLSPRNRMVASQLAARGFATLLFDLLTAEEGMDRANVFDIGLLADRVVDAIGWAETRADSRPTSIPWTSS